MRATKRTRLTEMADAMTTAWLDDLEKVTTSSDCNLLAGERLELPDDGIDEFCKKSDVVVVSDKSRLPLRLGTSDSVTLSLSPKSSGSTKVALSVKLSLCWMHK